MATSVNSKLSAKPGIPSTPPSRIPQLAAKPLSSSSSSISSCSSSGPTPYVPVTQEASSRTSNRMPSSTFNSKEREQTLQQEWHTYNDELVERRKGLLEKYKHDQFALDAFITSEAANGRLSVIQQLLSAGASLNAKTVDGDPLIALVINFRDAPEFKKLALLIKKGADLNVLDKERRTLLERALTLPLGNHKIAVELLLKAKVNPNQLCSNGHLPLQRPVYQGEPSIVRLLINHQADPTLTAPASIMPAHLSQGYLLDELALCSIGPAPLVSESIAKTIFHILKAGSLRQKEHCEGKSSKESASAGFPSKAKRSYSTVPPPSPLPTRKSQSKSSSSELFPKPKEKLEKQPSAEQNPLVPIFHDEGIRTPRKEPTSHDAFTPDQPMTPESDRTKRVQTAFRRGHRNLRSTRAFPRTPSTPTAPPSSLLNRTSLAHKKPAGKENQLSASGVDQL